MSKDLIGVGQLSKLLRIFSKIVEKFREMIGNVRTTFGQCKMNYRKSLEKLLKNFVINVVYIINKR